MVKVWKSIQGRLIFIFLLTLVPVFLVGMYIHSWGIRAMRQSVEERTLTQLEVYTRSMESDIMRLISLQVDLINSMEIAWLANMHSVMSDYERGKSINDLQQRLRYLSSSSIYSAEASAYLLPLDMVVSSNHGADTLTPEDKSLMQAATSKSGVPLTFHNGEIYTSASFRLGGTQALYTVNVRFLQNQIKQELTQLNTASGATVAIFDDSRFTLDAGDSSRYPPETIRQLIEKIQPLSEGSGFIDTTLNQTKYFVLYSRCQKLDLTVCSLIPKDVLYEPSNRFMLMFWIYLILGIVVLVLFSMFVRRSIHRPMQILINTFGQMEHNNLDSPIAYSRNDEYGYLFERFNHMLKRLHVLINENYRQTILLRDAELKQLQSQINPHFLYNTYFMLHRMILSQDTDGAAQFSAYLGKYLQYITRNARDRTPLFEEVEHARIYTNIQALRFKGRISVTFEDLPQPFHSCSVPRLILQPILENVFEHGLRNKRADGLVHIHFSSPFGTLLKITVEDNGEEVTDSDIQRLNLSLKSREQETELTGLLNIHSRIQLLHGSQSGLSFSRSMLGGFSVLLTIYFKEDDHDLLINR